MLNVSLNYVRVDNSNNLLSNIKFQLKKSLIYTILGKNGSGKSTLIKSFTKLLDRRCYKINGEVIFEGINLLTLSNDALLKIRKDKIKYVLQDSTNCFDHLKRFEYYFDRIAKNKNEIDELLDYFLLPEYSQLSKLYVYEVSGGMAQRINFILALLSHPKIIILDEPTTGIDSAIANLLLLKLKYFVGKEGNIVLLVTHNLIFAKSISDKIAFLSNSNLSRFYSTGDFFNVTGFPELKRFLEANQE